MNIKVVLKIISILLLIISLFLVLPIIFSFHFQEQNTLLPLLLTILSILLFSGSCLFIFRNEKIERLSTRDSYLLVSLSWLLVSFFSALPFTLSGYIPSFIDAFFESMSGYTTTGASILTNIQALPKSLLFWRSLTHWFGGMGIIVLTVAVLPLLGIGGFQLLKAEAPGPAVDKMLPRIAQTAKMLWLIYIGFTVIETILLMFGKMSLFDALTHTFGTLATGGFSPKNTSVGHYNSAYIDGVITVFMLLAGINFMLHFRLLRGKIVSVFKDIELKTYLAVFFIATGIIAINLFINNFHSIGHSLRYASFQSASILTTTGFATTDFAKWPQLAQVVLFILMFIGGCSGSTGGGIKVVRIVSLFKQGINEMKYLLHPRGVFALKINDKPIRKDIMYAISGFVFLYFFMLIVTTLVVATSGQNIITSLTSALATVGNIGPGFGKIGPALNYAFYPAYVKVFLSFAMLVGRLEIYTIFCILTPMFWKKT